MKVYIVSGYLEWNGVGSAPDGEVIRVYNTREKAEKFLSEYKDKWEYMWVSEWDVE